MKRRRTLRLGKNPRCRGTPARERGCRNRFHAPPTSSSRRRTHAAHHTHRVCPQHNSRLIWRAAAMWEIMIARRSLHERCDRANQQATQHHGRGQGRDARARANHRRWPPRRRCRHPRRPAFDSVAGNRHGSSSGRLHRLHLGVNCYHSLHRQHHNRGTTDKGHSWCRTAKPAVAGTT